MNKHFSRCWIFTDYPQVNQGNFKLQSSFGRVSHFSGSRENLLSGPKMIISYPAALFTAGSKEIPGPRVANVGLPAIYKRVLD